MEDERSYFFIVRRTSIGRTWEAGIAAAKPCDDAWLDETVTNVYGEPQWLIDIPTITGLLQLGPRVILLQADEIDVTPETMVQHNLDGVVEIYDTWRE